MNCNCLAEVKRIQKELSEQQRTGNFRCISPIKLSEVTKRDNFKNLKDPESDQEKDSKVSRDQTRWFQFLYNPLQCNQIDQ